MRVCVSRPEVTRDVTGAEKAREELFQDRQFHRLLFIVPVGVHSLALARRQSMTLSKLEMQTHGNDVHRTTVGVIGGITDMLPVQRCPNAL
jgi:hypothetical protein